MCRMTNCNCCQCWKGVLQNMAVLHGRCTLCYEVWQLLLHERTGQDTYDTHQNETCLCEVMKIKYPEENDEHMYLFKLNKMKNSEFLTGICRLQEGNAFAGVAWSWTSTNKLASMPVAPWWWTKAASIAVSFVGVVCVSRVDLYQAFRCAERAPHSRNGVPLNLRRVQDFIQLIIHRHMLGAVAMHKTRHP